MTMQTTYTVAASQFGGIERGVVPLLPQVVARPTEGSPQIRSRCLPLPHPPKVRAAVAAEKIEVSIAYMTQNLNRPLQISTLAALVNISPSHYFALFKRHTGRAPMDYFTRLRMERARRLLDTSASSVKEVAAALGYDDPFYFSRVFKSVNQLAPSNYRIKQKSETELAENPPCES